MPKDESQPRSRRGRPSAVAEQISRDRLARDVLGVVQQICLSQIMHPRAAHEVCAMCGALERANRTCQVCAARRARSVA